MFVITYRGKPATLETLYDLETLQGAAASRASNEELNAYLTAKTRQRAKDIYVHYFGYTWEERADKVELGEVLVSAVRLVSTKRI